MLDPPNWKNRQSVRRSVDDKVCDEVCDEESLLFGCPLSLPYGTKPEKVDPDPGPDFDFEKEKPQPGGEAPGYRRLTADVLPDTRNLTPFTVRKLFCKLFLRFGVGLAIMQPIS